ncbi:MAG: hypothetical protein ACYS26_04465 [Planctomycetota bacterium]|jgi:hypothetical protein
MTEQELQAQRLERTIAKGRTRFILVRGVLGWGVTTAVLWSVLMAISEGWSPWSTLPTALALFPIGGYFWGAFACPAPPESC